MVTKATTSNITPEKLISAEESGWLVEQTGSDGSPEWFYLDDTEEDGSGWTKDANKALRFARHIDALNYVNDIGWTEVIITEHGWYGNALSSTDKPTTTTKGQNEALECLRAWKKYSPDAMKAHADGDVAEIYERGWYDAVVYLSNASTDKPTVHRDAGEICEDMPTKQYIISCLSALVDQAYRYMMITGIKDQYLECGIEESQRVLKAIRAAPPSPIQSEADVLREAKA